MTRSGGSWALDPSGAPFPGFQWRNEGALNIDWIWLENYVAMVSPQGSVRFEHVVLATSYIGPTHAESDATPGAVLSSIANIEQQLLSSPLRLQFGDGNEFDVDPCSCGIPSAAKTLKDCGHNSARAALSSRR